MDDYSFILEIKLILKKILEVDSDKVNLINQMQDKVWNYVGCGDDKRIEALVELAYDLDFYQPDSEIRKEDNSLYGDERMIKEIQIVLSKLD